MKTFFCRYKKDLILLCSVLGLALFSFFLLRIFQTSGDVAEISIDGVLTETLDLSENIEKVYTKEDGSFNRVVIENGEVYVTDANCRDHLCMHQGKKKESGETIICLPHRFVVTVVRK